MKFCTAIVFLLAYTAPTATAFAPSKRVVGASTSTSHTSLKIVVGDTTEEFEARVEATFERATPVDPTFEDIVKGYFGGAIANQDLVATTARILKAKGYHGDNTLLATSLCCDELARKLEDDFHVLYGNNFNLGGLAGFPFAGKTGFGAMAAHIPDDGYCLVVYGPHVGVASDGTVGKVERSGINLVDTCCGSAVAAAGYVESILSGSQAIHTGLQDFLDFQQQGVQQLILPHAKRLADAEHKMVELPYALYESQDLLLTEIVQDGSTKIKRGLTMLGGIQINTGPDTPDYFVPLKFQRVNYRGEVVDDLLNDLKAKTGNLDQNSIESHTWKDDVDQGDNSPTTEGGDRHGDEGNVESNTKSSSRIQESAKTVAQSDVITEKRDMDGDGDASGNANDKQGNATPNAIEDTANAVVQSYTIIGKADSNGNGNGNSSDGDGDSHDDDDGQRKTKPNSNEDTAKVVAQTNVIIGKGDGGDRDRDRDSVSVSVSDNDEQKKTKPHSIEDVAKDIVQCDTIIKKSDGGVDGNSKDINAKPNSIEDTAKIVAQSDTMGEKDDGEEDEKKRSTGHSPIEDTAKSIALSETKLKEGHRGEDKKMRDVENYPIEEKAKAVAQIDTIRDEERENDGDKMEASNISSNSKAIEDVQHTDAMDDGKDNEDKNEINETKLRDDSGVLEDSTRSIGSTNKSYSIDASKNEANSYISSQINPLDAGKKEALIESSKEINGIIDNVQTFAMSDERTRDELSSDSSSNRSNVIEAVQTFARNDDKEKDAKTESDGIDLLLDENHMSWLTTADIDAVTEGDTTAKSNTKEERTKHDDGYSSSIDSIEQDEDGYDEESIYVGDTYLLGEQIASALEIAEIDVVGVDDEEAIAPALADALLGNIERDAYNQKNEGWNQFGAETLYSIGEEDMDRLQDGFSSDDGAFTDEFLQHISTETAATPSEDDSDLRHSDGEEIVLVADSILNIINRDEDEYEYDEENPLATPIVDTSNANTGTDGGDKGDEPPTSYRYVLEPDGFI